MIRAAMLSFWHVHAGDYVRQTSANPGIEIVAAWDEDPIRGQQRADEIGVPLEPSIESILSRHDIDAVIVETPTTMHRDVMVAAAQAGKHIFTEKVVATTLAECDEILSAVEEAGVILTVSLPRLYDGYTAAISEQLASGRYGDITLVRTRLSHSGALGNAWLPAHFFNAKETGGGALIDLGCHPMYLARLFLGERPEAVSASFGHLTGREVEDNAVAILHCASGAVGVVEAGFVNKVSPFAIEVFGTEGALLFGTPDAKLLARAGDESEWTEIPVPDNSAKPFDGWVSAIESGTPTEANLEAARDLTALMEAATASAATGSAVALTS